MATRSLDGSITKQTTSRTPPAIGGRGPTLLVEAEFNNVAAAGSKLGGSTEGRGSLGSPLTLSA